MIDPYFIAMSAFTAGAVLVAIVINYLYHRSKRNERSSLRK
ncbi:MAG: hypothetical protein ACE5IY_11635 [bacterium]